MPTYETACDVYRGDPKALWKVGLGLFTRALFIAAGIAVMTGEKRPGALAKLGMAGSLGVETFVIGWVILNSPRRRRR